MKKDPISLAGFAFLAGAPVIYYFYRMEIYGSVNTYLGAKDAKK